MQPKLFKQMKAESLSKERAKEILAVYAEYLPAERLVVVTFNNKFDEIVLAQGQDRDYKISYWDKNNEETHICLGAMNELDAEHKFNDMFPDYIFITAKEI